jgi:GT2 family glycosyltransferase
MRPVTIVVLGKYKAVFDGFRHDVDQRFPHVPKVFIRDGDEIAPPPGWTVIQGPERFSMAGNANLGWRAAPPDSDILYVGDDVRFTSADAIERLQEAAYSDPSIGIVSPKIVGGCNQRVQIDPTPGVSYSERRLCFICVYIKREVIDRVGCLDEQFEQYSPDDTDYCLRVKDAGYRLAVTAEVTVQHGVETDGTSTFRRNRMDVEAQFRSGLEKLKTKWGHTSEWGGCPPLRDVTALIKTFLRDDYLFTCVQSLRETYPDIRIIVGDDGRHTIAKERRLRELGVERYLKLPYDVGTCFGRNRLLDACETPYFLLGDDDFHYDERARLWDLRAMMQEADIAGGAVSYQGQVGHYEARLVFHDNPKRVTCEEIDRGYLEFQAATHQRIRYAETDVVFNFFIGKTEVARRIRWDESLHAIDHDDFFLSAYQAGTRVVYCPDSIVTHRQVELPVSQEYVERRFNNNDGPRLIEKWGQHFLPMSGLTGPALAPAIPQDVAVQYDERMVTRFLTAPYAEVAHLALEAYRRASVAERDGALDEAVPVFERILAESPLADQRAGAAFHLGEIAIGRGDALGAISFFTQCVELNPAHGKGKARLVELEARLGDGQVGQAPPYESVPDPTSVART